MTFEHQLLVVFLAFKIQCRFNVFSLWTFAGARVSAFRLLNVARRDVLYVFNVFA